MQLPTSGHQLAYLGGKGRLAVDGLPSAGCLHKVQLGEGRRQLRHPARHRRPPLEPEVLQGRQGCQGGGHRRKGGGCGRAGAGQVCADHQAGEPSARRQCRGQQRGQLVLLLRAIPVRRIGQHIQVPHVRGSPLQQPLAEGARAPRAGVPAAPRFDVGAALQLRRLHCLPPALADPGC